MLLFFVMECNIARSCAKISSLGNGQNCVDILGHMVQQCVLDQSKGYWLLSMFLLLSCHLCVNFKQII